MNNHTNICQNINMIIFLIFLISGILILINKKVKVNVDFSVIGFEYNFCITINYFFDVITLYKEDVLKYKNKYDTRSKDISKKRKNINDYKWIIELFNIERINFEAKIGIADVFFTSMLIPFVSTFVAVLLEKYCKTCTKTFSIKPVYNELFFCLKGATYITVKLKDVIYIVYKIWKESKIKV